MESINLIIDTNVPGGSLSTFEQYANTELEYSNLDPRELLDRDTGYVYCASNIQSFTTTQVKFIS